MASIDKRRDGKWRARYREFPGGPQKTKHFPRKIDAEKFLVSVQHSLLAGTYLPPEAARLTLASYYEKWLARMTPSWRPGTVQAVRTSFERHILPTLGSRPLTAVRRGDIEALCASLPLAASTVAVVAQHLGQLLRAAVEDGLLVKNPAYRARLPRRDAEKPRPIPMEDIRAVESALPD